jgi:hypothetical protein
MFVSKSIVQTSMREDEFGTFAQNVRKMSSRTRFVNNYFHVTHLRLLVLLPHLYAPLLARSSPRTILSRAAVQC